MGDQSVESKIDSKSLLELDQSLFDSFDLTGRLNEIKESESQTSSQCESQTSQGSQVKARKKSRFAKLSLKKETGGSNQTLSAKSSGTIENGARSFFEEDDIFDSVDNITQQLMQNNAKLSTPLESCDVNRKENERLKCSQDTQVIKQIQSVSDANKSQSDIFKAPNARPLSTSGRNLLKRTLSARFDEVLLNNSNRVEIDHFFDQIEHSISMMGIDIESTAENMSQVIDALFSNTLNQMGTPKENVPAPISQRLQNITWHDDSLSGVNSSFATTLRNAFLANVSRDVISESLVLNETRDLRSEFKEVGPFYGLPLKVKELIKLYKGIDELYDWQDECLSLPAIKNRNNLIYALPTSGGKTLVAEILMLRELICCKRNALFILPFVAIVQEKVWTLSPFAVALDFLVEEYASSKGTYPPRKRRRKNSIYIATIEKALGLVNSLIETERINEIGLIVVDELHLVGEQGRGATLEALLTKIMHIKADIQIVGMSATIGNVGDLCKFLEAEIYQQNFRPVELTEYVKCGSEIAKINWSKDEEEMLAFERRVDFGYSNSVTQIDPDHLGGLVMEVVPEGSCLIFCPSKKNCENVAYLLCRVLNKKLTNHLKEEKEQIKYALRAECETLCKVLNVSIQFGIAYHHSGLTNEERRIIEDAFRAGVISVICCTSTLAAGVNLPAKRVILRQPYIARDFINLSRYKQMVGRAGRAGFGETGESILICAPPDLGKVKKLLMSPMDRALSNMHECDGKGLRHLLLSCISLGIANTRPQLQEVARRTLLHIQSEQLEVNVKKLTDRAISELFKMGALQEGELCKPENGIHSDVTIRMETSTSNMSLSEVDLSQIISPKKKRRIVIKNATKLVISKLGCAAIKGGFELARAHMLYKDLYQAQKSLVLLDCLHLLYLVTPYDIAEQIRPNKTDYYNIYSKLGTNELQTAKILGIDDSIATKMLTNQKIKNVSEKVLNRFYLTLMLYDLWNEQPVFDVSEKYQVDRGVVQNLMTSSATFASNVVHFCEGLEEFWTFAHLLKGMSQRLSHCCVRELVPLMELPAVKQNRAKQLYNAGYKTLQSIAKANEENLTESIEFLPRRVAKQLIAAAKMLLLEKVENLREEAEDVLNGVEPQTRPFP